MVRKLSLLISLFTLVLLSACGNPSGESVVSKDHTPLLKPPTAFSFTQIIAANGNVTIKWQQSDRASEYKVTMGTSATDITTIVTGCSESERTCEITGLTAGTLYYFSIEAINPAGSKIIDETGTALSVGTFDITSSSVGDAQMTVSWDASAGATSYNILYGTTSGNYPQKQTNVTSPYTLTGLQNGLTYYVRIVAVNSNNGYLLSTSEASGEPFGPPPAPAGLVLTAGGAQVNLNWNDVGGADSYKIYRGTSSGALSEIANSVTVSQYVDTSVTDGVTYYYAIMAYNGQDSALSAISSVQSIANFSATSVAVAPAAQQLTVTFPSVTGATGYDIIYGTSSSNLNLTASNVTSPRVLTGLTGGSTYYIRVVAKNSIGSGTRVSSSNTLSATPIRSLTAPTGFTGTATPAQVLLNWTAVSGASSYEVLRGTTTGSYTSLQSGILGTSYTDTGLTNGTTYYYVVRAYNGFNSANSSEISKKPIQAFSISSLTPASSSSLTLNWAATTGADTYDVSYGTTSGSYTTSVTNVTSPYTISGLAANTTYYVVLKGNNAVGGGTIYQTTQASALTKTAAPTGLVATSTPGQIVLDWSSVTGASTYAVYRGTTSGSYAAIATGLTDSNYTDGTIINGTTYYYVVRANNGTESANSTEVPARSISSFSITSTTATSPSTISVTWPAISGATTYDIKYGTSTGSYTTTITNKTSPATVTGLNSGSTYYITVVAKNAIGTGATQNSVEVVQTTPMGPPNGLTATVTNGQIALSWTAVPSVSSYKVYRGTVSGTYSLLASNIVPTSYTDTTVTAGTTYYYVVKSYNGIDSANSLEVLGKPIANFTLTSVTAPTATSVQVTFPTTSGGDLYDVLYGTTTGTYTTTASAVTSPHTITGLSGNTDYFVTVRARNTVGSGAARSTAELSVKTPVAAPTSVVASAGTSLINLSWGAVSGATSYKVYRGTTTGVHTLIASGITATTFSDTSVANGITYYYTIVSYNGSDSGKSAEVLARPIVAISISSITATASTIQVSWPTATGATAYDVRYGTTSGTYTSTISAGTPYTISASRDTLLMPRLWRHNI